MNSAKRNKYDQLGTSEESLQHGNLAHHVDYNQLAKDAALYEDDYDVTSKRIDWSGISIASVSDIQKIRMLEGSGDELLASDNDIRAIFFDETDSVETAQAFLNVLETRIAQQITYIITLLQHILQQDCTRGESFLRIQNDDNNNIIQTFSRIWARDDISKHTAGKAAICAGIILGQAYNYELKLMSDSAKDNQSDEKSNSINNINININMNDNRYLKYDKEYRLLNEWIIREFKKKNDKLLPSLYTLKGLMSNNDFHILFCKENGIDRLFSVLEENVGHKQVVYLVCYCLWALSFTDDYANHDGLLNGQLLNKLVELINITKTKNQKIARIILQMCENLLGKSNFNEMAVLFGLFPILTEMSEEKIEDVEMRNSVTKLLDGLNASVVILSSFEQYKTELRSDKLTFGPCHTEKFWKKYAHLFEEDNYKLIKDLITLLSTNTHDAETLAVICYDLGEWSRFYSDGKRVIEKFGGKELMMSLISHQDADVRKYALSGVQKLLIKNWQNLDSAKT